MQAVEHDHTAGLQGTSTLKAKGGEGVCEAVLQRVLVMKPGSAEMLAAQLAGLQDEVRRRRPGARPTLLPASERPGDVHALGPAWHAPRHVQRQDAAQAWTRSAQLLLAAHWPGPGRARHR